MLLVGAASVLVAAEPAAGPLLIRLGPDRRPEVVSFPRAQAQTAPAGSVLLWSEGQGDRWIFPPAEGDAEAARRLAEGDSPAGGARGLAARRGDLATPGDDPALATVTLDQLVGQGIVRGRAFLTPMPGGRHLDGRLTVRRLASAGAVSYPAATVVLQRGHTVLLKITLHAGQRAVAWAAIPDLPPAYQQGLPPGTYRLSLAGGGDATEFTVEDAATREDVLDRVGELARLLGSELDPLCVQVAAHALLTGADRDGRPQPYVADVLDRLERVPTAQRTPYLDRLEAEILTRLTGDSPALKSPDPFSAARRLLSQGRWREALAQLEGGGGEPSVRRTALERLYRAAILAEFGQGGEAEAALAFAQALDLAAGLPPAEAFRIYNNFANFRLGAVQDRLYNHAFQIASGVQSPLTEALRSWQQAAALYEEALRRVGPAPSADQAAVRVNQARLYAVLADVVRTLDAPRQDGRHLVALEQAAAAYAHDLAAQVVAEAAATTDGTTRAAAAEILGRLAFRSGRFDEAREQAQQARRAYLDAGSLAGVEGVERLLGLGCLRQEQTLPEVGGDEHEVARQALRHLEIARVLAEVLREQVPADRTGRSRAGFFARHTYVYERIVELFLAEGDAAQALDRAELAKARTLQDVLAARQPRAVGPGRPVAEILAAWPRDFAAIEYFLGAERAWAFLVKTNGAVEAAVLTDSDDPEGRPLAARALVARTRQFLAGLPRTNTKIAGRLSLGQPFDRRWQAELHEFYRTLLPAPFLAEIRQAKTLLIVPHGLLHYFPFAALVTQPDATRRAAVEMVQPRFLLDESFSITYAPSLLTWDALRSREDRPLTAAAAVGLSEFRDGSQTLANVEQELANFRLAFGTRVQRVVTEREATAAAARELLRQRGLLLVATHGVRREDSPLQSYLLLEPSGNHDGHLTAEELYGTAIGRDLIVMNACYSGLADRAPWTSDDLFGLERALLYAGARSIVASLWDVDDIAGAALSQLLFREMGQGQPVAVALAEAQRALLRDARKSSDVACHPYFWAVHKVTGDDRTHFSPGRGPRGPSTAEPPRSAY